MNRYIKGRISKGEFVSELFKQRVESKGGTYEANDCLVNTINSLTDREFKDAKLILTPNGYLVDKLPTIKPNGGGDATVVRNVVKTRVNSLGLIESMAANVLAPDYLNGVCPALNVEGQSTNLFQYSEQFDNAYWDKAVSVINPNLIASPDGTITADELVDSNAGGTGLAILTRAATLNAGSKYTVSVFVKKKGLTQCKVEFFSFDGNYGSFFDLQNGIVLSDDAGVFSSKITSLNNDWYKCEVTLDTTGKTDLDGFIRFYPAQNESTTVDRDGTSSIYLWGAQLGENEGSTSYTPTTTASVTRSADTVTVPIPAGTTEIIEKYEDGTTNTITTIPASPYTVPTGKRYKYILMR